MNSTPFLGLKRILAILLFAGLVAVPFAIWAASKDKDKGGYPDYTRLEYAKPLPPVEEQIRQPKPGSINRKFGEVPEDVNQGADPLNSIPIPLLRPAAKVDNSEPPITEILEEGDFTPSTSTVPASASAGTAPALNKQDPGAVREPFKTAPVPVSSATTTPPQPAEPAKK